MSLSDGQQSDMFQARAISVIEPLVPADAEERVKNTLRQLNNVVRECIRAEMGLKLADNLVRASIPIRVVEGFPDVFPRLISWYNNPAIWILLAAQTKLGRGIDGFAAPAEFLS